MLGHRERYLWVDNDFDLAWTVAVVEGGTERSTVAAYGGNRQAEPVGEVEFAQAHVAEDDLGDFFLIQTMSYGRHTVIVENNGWLGADRDVARRASAAGGRFFSVYWSPAGDRVVQAVDGELVAWFEPLSIGDTSGEGNLYPDWLHDFVFTTDGLHSTMLAVMEQQTGLAFNRGWLHEPLPTYRIRRPI
jgi:hypothetical protein